MKVFHKILFSTIFSLVSVVLNADQTHTGYKVKKLVSNIHGLAEHRDPLLVNPWGALFTPNGTLVVANNGTNLGLSFDPEGHRKDLAFTAKNDPTGIIQNHFSNAFKIQIPGGKSKPAQFLLAGEDGTISAYKRAVDRDNALVVIDNSADNAVYKGLAIETIKPPGQKERVFLLAADFHNAVINVFNSKFQLREQIHVDNLVPPGFAPFNLAEINQTIYFTFAKQLPPENRDDEPGPGNGFVVFGKPQTHEQIIISQGPLNSPWGIAVAPKNFGEFSETLLIGNFGDGKINAFNQDTGEFLGSLNGADGEPIVIDGLWSIFFEPSSLKEPKAKLYFTAGLNDEEDGLLGFIEPR